MTKDGINFTHRTIKALPLGKGSNERIVPLLPIVKSAIDDYIESCPYSAANNRYLFLNKWGNELKNYSYRIIIKKIREENNFSDNITPHSFRHSCATHLLNNNGGLREIQELLGHSSIISTQRYTEVSSTRLLSVYAKAHPRS